MHKDQKENNPKYDTALSEPYRYITLTSTASYTVEEFCRKTRKHQKRVRN